MENYKGIQSVTERYDEWNIWEHIKDMTFHHTFLLGTVNLS